MPNSPADEARNKTLDHLQGIITRLAGNSFSIKGWAITLSSALLGFALKDSKSVPELAYLALIPTVAFWILGGYYLAVERSVRGVYNSLATSSEPTTGGIPVLRMSVGAIARAIFWPATLLLYVALGICEILVGLGVFGNAARLLSL
jgi:hypothetical protein